MICPTKNPIASLSYSEFSQGLHEKTLVERVPISGSIEITHRCNLSCAHCYVKSTPIDHQSTKAELTTQQWFDVIDQITEKGCLWLLISGGEPLIRSDFSEIYLYAKKSGLIISLFTNGTLITPAIAEMLAEHRPFTVEISLYGHSCAVYESVTGSPSALNDCRRGIGLLQKYGIPLDLKTTLSQLNAQEVKKMQKWAATQGLTFRFDVLLNPKIDGSRKPCDIRLTPQQAVEIDLADKKRLNQWKKLFLDFSSQTEMENIYSCGAGHNGFHIDPYGDLCLCMMARHPSISLKDTDFSRSWDDFLLSARAQKRTKAMRCDVCDVHLFCDQCAGWAMIENGDPETVVDYLCEVAHRRKDKVSERSIIETNK